MRPCWGMFQEHLAMIEEQIISMLNKDFEADIAVTEGLEMADVLSEAIIKQFSSVFI